MAKAYRQKVRWFYWLNQSHWSLPDMACLLNDVEPLPSTLPEEKRLDFTEIGCPPITKHLPKEKAEAVRILHHVATVQINTLKFDVGNQGLKIITPRFRIEISLEKIAAWVAGLVLNGKNFSYPPEMETLFAQHRKRACLNKNQENRVNCIAHAREMRLADPELTVAAAARDATMKQLAGNISPDRLERWIAGVFPNRKRGRPRKKSSLKTAK